MEDTDASSSSLKVQPKRKHASIDSTKGKKRKAVFTSSDTDQMYNSECSTSSSGKVQVSNWTLQRAEMYGLCYDSESSDISRFYELFTGKNSSFKYPLEEEKRKVVESLTSQADKIDRPGVTFKEGEKWRTWIRYRHVLEKCEKTLQSIDNELNSPPRESKLLVLSQSAIRRFYICLKEFLIQSDRTLAQEKPITEQSYTELCCKFLEIFLLNVRSGAMEKSVMMIKGVRNSSVPDLRLTLPVPSISSFGRTSSVVVIGVVEVKPDYDETVHSESFQIVKAVKNKILGQHAGELLLDLKMSVLAEIGAIFGIICMRTNLIFTCLKMSWKHYESIKMYGEDVTIKGMTFDEEEEDEEEEDEKEDEKQEEEEIKEKNENNLSKSKTHQVHSVNTSGNLDPKIVERKEVSKNEKRSGTIFYTRPYNYLIKDDRNQIKEFLFWLGVQVETLDYN